MCIIKLSLQWKGPGVLREIVNDPEENRTNFLHCTWQSFSKCAYTYGNLFYMFFSFGCWLNLSMTLWNTIIVGRGNKKDGFPFCFEWFSSMKNMPAERVESYRHGDRQRETHFWKPDGDGERNRGKEGEEEMNWDGMGPNFQVIFSSHPTSPLPARPFFFSNTEKCTFFPHKSAWTVCFCNLKKISPQQRHQSLHPVITGKDGEQHPFKENHPRGGGCRDVKWWGCIWRNSQLLYPQQHIKAKQPVVSDLKIGSHVVLTHHNGLHTHVFKNFYKAWNMNQEHGSNPAGHGNMFMDM